MTIDPETKEYIDSVMTEHSIKISAFLSSICNMLEEKHVITRDDFDVILERANNVTTFAMTMGAQNFTESVKDALESSKKDVGKWRDLK